MLSIFYFIILLSAVFSDGVNKFCGSNVCNNSKQHTLCRFPSPGPARHCLDYEKTVKSERDRQALLDKINSRRNKVAAGEIRSLPPAQDMLEMVWNAELEESAQRWADQCVTHRHSVGDVLDACRDLVDMSVGQNIATVYGEAPGLTVTSLVDVWYMELLNVNSTAIPQYWTSNDTKSPSYKYFTQLVWANSFQVGCGGIKFKGILAHIVHTEVPLLSWGMRRQTPADGRQAALTICMVVCPCNSTIWMKQVGDSSQTRYYFVQSYRCEQGILAHIVHTEVPLLSWGMRRQTPADGRQAALTICMVVCPCNSTIWMKQVGDSSQTRYYFVQSYRCEQERFDELDETRNRTVYRLVCNFAPRGNQVGKPVYSAGPTGSKCIYGLCKKHKSLCKTKPPSVGNKIEYGNIRNVSNQSKYSSANEKINDKDVTTKIFKNSSTLKSEVSVIADTYTDDDNTTFDYFSFLYEFTKDKLTSTTPKTSICKKDMAIDEIVDFLKKKLSDDPTLKEFFTTTLPLPTGGTFKDESVAAFLDKIYSKTTPASATETPNADFVNSTLLVNLVEAVIFRNKDNVQTAGATHEIQLRPFNFAHPVRVQAEVVEAKPNYDITGHYFFPEDDVGETTKETTEPDYDISYAPSMQDVVLEIEELRKKRPTSDFLYDILETESVAESTTKVKLLSPDDLNLHTSGYINMKNFLKEISEKSQST